jgi:hypothetical protein
MRWRRKLVEPTEAEVWEIRHMAGNDIFTMRRAFPHLTDDQIIHIQLGPYR